MAPVEATLPDLATGRSRAFPHPRPARTVAARFLRAAPTGEPLTNGRRPIGIGDGCIGKNGYSPTDWPTWVLPRIVSWSTMTP